MVSRLQLNFLGPFQVFRNGEPIARFESNKVRALLVYLAVEGGRPHSREALCGLLWPDWPQSSALSSLRNALADLRKNLDDAHADPPFLLITRDSLQLNPDSDFSLDVHQFQFFIQTAQNSKDLQSAIDNQKSAITLYRGSFLEGISLPENNLFEEWLGVEREHLRQQLLAALQRLADTYEQQGETEQALAYCRRQLEIEPWLEEEHRRAMRLLALAGQRGASLAQYETCRELLDKELGVEPGAETLSLYKSIRDGGFEAGSAQAKETIPMFAPGMLVNQRYRLEEVIGEGGLGVIYRALDTLLERQVAIKVLHAEGLGTEGRAKLLREAQIIAKLNHPNIITMYDAGEAAKTPYLVMELIEGTPLDRLIPLPVEKILSLTAQICSALEYAHGHGIIHRDLKPGNILLEQNSRVKLMDFGLARSIASRMTTEGVIAGTVFYMAPEQALGKAIDARADLYSLGVILYELATGEVPFSGEDPLAVISQHLHAAVIPPRLKTEDIPDALSDLILQLLSKDPGDRPESAAEVLKVLDRISKGETEALTPRTANITRQRPPIILDAIPESNRPVFVAREVELEKLRKILEDVLCGKGSLVFITGDAGSGKTALLREFARQACEDQPDLLAAAGSCNPYSGVGDPYLPLRSVLRTLMGNLELVGSSGIIDREQALRLFQALPQALQSLVSSGSYLVDTFLPGGELLAQAESLGAIPPELKCIVEQSANRSYNLAQQILFEQYCAVLRGLSKDHPLLILLDDLQWADNASAGLLYHLGTRLENSRILVLCAYRPEEVFTWPAEERHPLKKVLAEYKRLHGDAWLDLTCSDECKCREFIGVFLDTEPNRLGEAFRHQLFGRTGGHALFTIELLRAMQERGGLVQDPDGCWVEGPVLDWESLPARVEAVIAERIGRLAEELRQALTVASVEGEEFTAEVVARIRGMDTRQLTRQLSEKVQKEHGLARAQGLKRVAYRKLSLYRFQHNLFQQYLYNGLDSVERASLHEEVGNALEALYWKNTDEIAPELARHFEEAGLTEKAVHYLQQAGGLAAARYANQEAVQYFSRALAIISESDVDRRFSLLMAREKVYGLLGQVDAQWSDLETLEETAKQLESKHQGWAAVRKAIYFNNISDYPAGEAVAEKAIILARQIGDRHLEAEACLRLGYILWGNYKIPEAKKQAEYILSLAQELGLRSIEAKCLNLLSLIAEDAEARIYVEQYLKIFQEMGDRINEIVACLNLGISFIVVQPIDLNQAQYYLNHASQVIQDIGAFSYVGDPPFYLGWLCYVRGDYFGMRNYMVEAVQNYQEINELKFKWKAMKRLGKANALIGDFEESIQLDEQCLQDILLRGNPIDQASCTIEFSLIYIFLGNFQKAEMLNQQAVQILMEMKKDYSSELDELMAKSYLGKILIYMKDFCEAQNTLETISSRLHQYDCYEEANALLLLAEAHAGQGHFAEAVMAVQQAETIWNQYGSQGRILEAQAILSSIHLGQGEKQRALADIQEILTEYAAGRCFMGAWEPARIYLTTLHVLQANGDPRAEDLLQAGYNLIQERAARINDLERRRSYLENMPYNREIIQLWKARK